MPMRSGAIVRCREAGFLLDLPSNTARDIHRAPADVVKIRRSRRKVNAAGIRGMLTHFAENEHAVGTPQRAHPESIEDGPVRATPVAPRQETCKISVEVGCAEAFGGELRIAAEQHTAFPNRLLALLDGEMRLDLGAPLLRERPVPGLKRQIKCRDVMNDRRRHAVRLFLFGI